MSHASTELNYDPAEEIKTRYQLLKQQQPEIRARNAAEELGVSEGELLASRVGDDAIRLIDDAEAVLKAVLPLGEVMALRRINYERAYDERIVFFHGVQEADILSRYANKTAEGLRRRMHYEA